MPDARKPPRNRACGADMRRKASDLGQQREEKRETPVASHLQTSGRGRGAKVLAVAKRGIDTKGPCNQVERRVDMLVALLVQKGLEPRVVASMLLQTSPSLVSAQRLHRSPGRCMNALHRALEESRAVSAACGPSALPRSSLNSSEESQSFPPPSSRLHPTNNKNT